MHKIKEEIRIEEIELKVLNLEEMIEFYEQILGFKVLKESNEYAILGSNKNPFLKLLRDEKSIKEEFNSVGLYHVAYLLPNRKDLAIMLKHLLEKEAPIEGFADHLVSEAIYLHDIEGNGIEIYCDKPREEWIRIGSKIAMSTEPLDVDRLLNLANGEWKGKSDETRIGHIHLKVSSLSRTENFYTKALGLDLTFRYYGAIFLSSGGYHHHIGANVWQSLGAPPRREDMRGLSYFTIKLPSKEDFEGIMKNLREIGMSYVFEGEKIKIKDPDNINIILKI
jgi:catechol 2,3-dioxygenase